MGQTKFFVFDHVSIDRSAQQQRRRENVVGIMGPVRRATHLPSQQMHLMADFSPPKAYVQSLFDSLQIQCPKKITLLSVGLKCFHRRVSTIYDFCLSLHTDTVTQDIVGGK